MIILNQVAASRREAETRPRLELLDRADTVATPPRPTDLIAKAKAARDGGRLDEAAALLSAARSRFPADAEALIETGWLAHIRHNWGEAAGWWQAVRLHAPHHIVGFVQGAIAAREQGYDEEAAYLLADAELRFPHDPSPWIERAWLAQRRQDWREAAERWTSVQARFPTLTVGYSGAALALREQRRFAEADAVLDAALQQHPADIGLMTERGWVAHVAHDWPEADRRWTRLRQLAPGLSVGYTSGAVALREQGCFAEAEALLDEAIARFPDLRDAWTERAWLDFARRDWPAASARWADVRARFPDFAEAWLRGAICQAEAWDHAGAEALLQEAMTRFPRERSLLAEHAALALRQNRLDEAGLRFARLRAQFPDEIAGHLGGAMVLRNSFRLDEAASLLEAAQRVLPDEKRLWLEHALLPVFAPLRRDRDPDEALRRLAALHLRFPDYPDAILAHIRQLQEAGQIEQAASMAREAVLRLPDSEALAMEAGTLALAQADWPWAESVFRAACARFPDQPGGAIGLAKLLAATGELAAAEAALQDVIARFPAASAAYIAYAELAMDRQDWPEALARWTAAHQRFPDDKAFAQRIFDVRLNLVGETAADAAAGGETVDAPVTPKDLVMRFESLGGRGLGCEFGMFQREFGAEPLGLLRWADMPFEGIIQVLESRFEGVGLPENTEVFVSRETVRAEYCTRDLRGFMFMRAFVYEDQMPIERMRKQALQRLVYLKSKLIEDLEAGSKIFIWRCTERTLTEAELARLHRAVRSYGENTLLYVRLQDAGHPNGTIEVLGDGLMIGYIDRFKLSPDGELASAPASASWLTLCERAMQLS